MIKAKTLFTLIVGGAILFYFPFNQGLLFNIGPAKVYAQDLVTAIFIIYIAFAISTKNNNSIFYFKSSKYFLLFFIWGVISFIRGLYIYGYHAVGEARWYVFIILYYFFILLFFKQRKHIVYFLKRIIFFINFMIVIHFIQFYFLPTSIEKTGRLVFRFINAIETLLVAFMFIWFFYLYLNKYNIISKKYLYLILAISPAIILIVQTRSVWLASVGGLVAVLYYSRKISVNRFLMAIIITVTIFFSALPLISNFTGSNVSASILKYSKFLQDPEQDATGSWRLIGWMQEIEKFKNHPITGEGLGGYSEWYVNGQWLRVMVHNGYIMNLSKFGLIGFSLLLLGVLFWLKEINRYIKYETNIFFKLLARGFEIAIFMHLIYTIFYDYTIFFWIILGLGSSLIISSDNNSKRNKLSNRHNYIGIKNKNLTKINK